MRGPLGACVQASAYLAAQTTHGMLFPHNGERWLSGLRNWLW